MATKPLLRDFIGLNVHTVQFRPELYAPTARLLRDYHGYVWDVGEETDYEPRFPMSRNKVDWQQLYGGWVKSGYEINVCLMFDQIKPDKWKDLPRDAYRYGEAFARYFGPSGPNKLATSMEIGNEPGGFPDKDYRALFENVAKGLRKGDPRLKVVTCATFAQKSGEYHKSLETVRGLDPLYDVINVHSYAQVEGWPTWRRSFPEDPKIVYLKDIEGVIDWRNKNARGKEIWLTEFGWDSSTKPNDKEGTFKDWVGVTDTQQAQYIVRSFLVFSAMELDRAYLYWFNDEDKPSIHAAAGLTRNYQPKPSYYAQSHLLKTLGDYRFARVVQSTPGDAYIYEFQHGKDKSQYIWAVWSATGSNRTTQVALKGLPGKIQKAEQMPLAPGAAPSVRIESGSPTPTVQVSESPLYVWVKK